MTLTEALKERTEGKELHLRNPDVRGTYVFDADLNWKLIGDDGNERPHSELPWGFKLNPSDITRTDWSIAPIAED